MKQITVADVRKKIADDIALSEKARKEGIERPEREEWYPIRRMSDEEIAKAITAGFSWVAAMDIPYDPDAPFDLADDTDAEVEEFFLTGKRRGRG